MRKVLTCTLVLMLLTTIALAENLKYDGNTSDFLADEARVEYAQSLYNGLRMGELLEYARGYADTVQPPESDSVWSVLEILEAEADAINAMCAETDDFDGAYSFTFPNVDAISDSHHIVPFYNDDDWLMTQLGFTADDWIYFDEVAISADGDLVWEYDFDYEDVLRDVLRDPAVMVKESTNILYDAIDSDTTRAICDSERAMIRFRSNEKDRQIVFELTAEEKSALDYQHRIGGLRSKLSKLFWDYAHR